MQRGPSLLNTIFPPCVILAWIIFGSLGHVYRATLLQGDSITKIRKLQFAVASPYSLPSPAPSSDCHQICADGQTSVPPSSPCGCVIPIRVGLELGVTLDILFQSLIELAKELADGSFLQQSQVRITSANPVTQDPDRTVVEADLVPLGTAFDNTTAELVAERFWTKQVFINESLFGNYSVEYVRYPGISSAPPTSVSDGGDGSPTSPGAGPNLGHIGAGRRKDDNINRGIVALIVLSSGFGLVLLLGAACMYAGWNSKHQEALILSSRPPLSSTFRESGENSLISSVRDNSTSLSFISSIAALAGFVRFFTVGELEKATERFHSKNLAGEGGFGRVYRGVLDDGSKIAVKVLMGAGNDFVGEVEMLSRLHHRNLVKLVGICMEDHIRCLVYELVPNGSLESHLHGDEKFIAPLDWETRIKIALGAARGLAYLHEDSNPRVIHRDFKSSNILLEDDFTPKVSDFGLAKVAAEGGTEPVSTRVMGTFGYVAPEYAMTGHLLVKSDVYSYGVVLLELLTGRKPVDMAQPSGQENLVTWARPLLTNRETVSMCIDPIVGADYPEEDLVKVANLAYMCVHPEVSQRPFMGEVVQALKLVYHEQEASEGNGSAPASTGVSPACGSAAFRSLSSGHWGAYSPYAPDSGLIRSIDYDSGPLNSINNGSNRAMSASAALPTSGLLLPELSGSFGRHSSSDSPRPTYHEVWQSSHGIIDNEKH